ncbi:MAG: hypothetical protein LBE92_05460 [Chryseobacterium sp.]|jgi:energy-coupling factor transporter transmembrane protein EcfT|uniref:hypothetical protein n=1 Tax=Chryseobacterium sp. TaxID=1871047 RepID=UPI002817D129|nr:hypothetical protein [Chryseobacterium sp.]MDR2235549.1 hypothetical protein [Chryseobacterium sp.]
MIKLITLIAATILLLLIFVIIFIFALVRKTKRFFILAVVFFLLAFSTGFYTLYFGLQKGKEKTGQVARNAFEKVFPTFNSDRPDTEANKKNFRNFIKVDITPDVKNIYCFDDAIGQDADYMFSFSCNPETAEKIIERHRLVKDSLRGNNQDGLQDDFFWWDKKKINELESYSWDSNHEGKNFHKIFWYDHEHQKAYYFEYDL